MKIIPEQIDIPVEKVTSYLLAKREKNDKSKFLFSLGYSPENWFELVNDIKNIALNNDVVLERWSEFGNLYDANMITINHLMHSLFFYAN